MIDAEKLVQEVENEKNWHGDLPGSPEQQVDYWREMEDPGAHSYNDTVSVSTISSHDDDGNENKNKVKTRFGTTYEGKQMSWHFTFFTEQNEVYGDINDPTGSLLEDFNLVPVINFCKETATFPTSTFITLDPATKNTYFSYAGESNK